MTGRYKQAPPLSSPSRKIKRGRLRGRGRGRGRGRDTQRNFPCELSRIKFPPKNSPKPHHGREKEEQEEEEEEEEEDGRSRRRKKKIIKCSTRNYQSLVVCLKFLKEVPREKPKEWLRGGRRREQEEEKVVVVVVVSVMPFDPLNIDFIGRSRPQRPQPLEYPLSRLAVACEPNHL